MTTHSDTAARPHLPASGCLITRIQLYQRFAFPAQHKGHAHSPPGHLVHLMLEGHLDLRIGQHTFHARAGDVIYYFEQEEVVWLGNPERVTFDSLAFLAPQLQPLGPHQRVFPCSAGLQSAFAALNTLWAQHRSPALLPLTYSHALFIASELIEQHDLDSGKGLPADNTWWEIEAALRRHQRYRVTLKELASQFKRSSATIARSCMSATGMPPGKRVQALRLEAAKGLLRYSMMSVSEIAEQLGYGRIHEFSREFAKLTGQPPRRWRASNTDSGTPR